MCRHLAGKRERHWGKGSMGGRQTERQVDWQTEKRRHFDILSYHTLFPSPCTWHITEEKVTFTLQLHASSWLTIVQTQKLLLFNMTSPCKKKISQIQNEIILYIGSLCLLLTENLSWPRVQAELLIVKCHFEMSKHTLECQWESQTVLLSCLNTTALEVFTWECSIICFVNLPVIFIQYTPRIYSTYA